MRKRHRNQWRLQKQMSAPWGGPMRCQETAAKMGTAAALRDMALTRRRLSRRWSNLLDSHVHHGSLGAALCPLHIFNDRQWR